MSLFRVPAWLDIKRQMVPVVVSSDPELCPVWEITGAEFSKAELHTAEGISIRFPRVTKERPDKTWKTATSMEELMHLYHESKNNIDIKLNTESDEEMDMLDGSTKSPEGGRRRAGPGSCRPEAGRSGRRCG